MRREFNYTATFDQLAIKASDLLDNSGQFDADQSAELLTIAGGAYEIGKSLTDISCKIVLTDIQVDGDYIVSDFCRMKPGRKINAFFKRALYGAFFVCTSGKKFEESAHEKMAKGELIEGYYIDLLGSMTVEMAMDKFQVLFAEEMQKDGFSISNRYSPGYCDWHVSDQHELFKIFPESFNKVTLSASSLMSPAKSISGIIGVGRDVKYREHHCDSCNSTTCIYRNINPRKGKKDY